VKRRALLRRAFPYLVIGIGGFALGYIIIYLFVLPSKIVPPVPPPYVPDSSHVLQPIDTGITPVADTALVPPLEQGLPPDTAHAPESPPTVNVPDLVDMSLPDARRILNGLRVHTAVVRDTSSFRLPGTVMRQDPAPQSQISQDGVVTLTVSYFPPAVPVDTMPGRSSSPPRPVRPPLVDPNNRP
jgi:hypothetical protein